MKTWYLILCLVVLGVLTATFTAYGSLYRWVDEQGEMHYSTVPPTDNDHPVEIKTNAGWQPYRSGQAEKESSSSRQKTASGVTKASISYVKRYNLMIFDVRLNDNTDVQFAMDTGASFVVISTKIAQKMGLSADPKLPQAEIVTANGVVKAPYVNLESVKVGSIEAYNVTAVIHPLEKWEDIDGLLGMSFFKRFEINVDARRNRVMFEALYPPEQYAAMNCVKAREWNFQGDLAGKDFDKATKCYEKAVLLCDDLYEAYYALADIYFDQERYAKGVETFLETVRRYPDNAHAHYLLGVFYAWDNKFIQAKREFQKTLKLDPEHEEAKKWIEEMRGKVYLRREK